MPTACAGRSIDFAWCDELAKWRQAEAAWDNLQMALRRGPRPRALVTTTPRPMRLLERIGDAPWTVTTRGRTSDNINLDEKFIELHDRDLRRDADRRGRSSTASCSSDVEGALWPREMIERRESPRRPALSREGEGFDRIVVGVDPPAGAGEGSDACGIVVAGSAASVSMCSRMRACGG